MRRVVAGLSVIALMIVATSAVASVKLESGSYKDVFPDITYSGSDGSIPWERSWYEIGEKDGPEGGMVHVYTGGCDDYKCLNIEGYGDAGTLGAGRYADLSIFQDAEVCFDVVAQLEDESFSTGMLSIQVAADGSNWKTIESYGLVSLNSESAHGQVKLNDYLSQGFGIRFVVTGTLIGEVYVDNVEIKGTFVPEPTTTTTTTAERETTTTVKATTTTTKHEETPTTTRPTTTTTGRPSTTTTTTPSTTTSTTVVAVAAAPPVPPSGSGIRETDSGVQASFSSGLFGSMEMGQIEVLDVELNADYSMAVELIETTWVWMIGLLVIIAGAIATGLDRRRTLKTAAST